MTNINNITTSDWQISKTGFGNIAQGADAINECLNIIMNTQKGTDPLRPEFGVDLLAWIDKPSQIMAPGLVSEIIDQISTYEQRVVLTEIKYTISGSRVLFSLVWTYPTGLLSKKPVYFLLADQNGFVLLDDAGVAIYLDEY